MVARYGQTHTNLLNLNRIADRGLEGPLNVITEVWRPAAALAMVAANNDAFESSVLRIVPNAHLYRIRRITPTAMRLGWEYQEEGDSSWTNIFAEADDTSAPDAAIGAAGFAVGTTAPRILRRPFFENFEKPVLIRARVLQDATLPAGGFFAIALEYLNL